MFPGIQLDEKSWKKLIRQVRRGKKMPMFDENLMEMTTKSEFKTHYGSAPLGVMLLS